MSKKLILTLALTEFGRTQVVAAIKAMRTATGWGLKEAKDVVDVLREAPDNAKSVVMLAEDLAMLILVPVVDWQGNALPPLFSATHVEVYGEPNFLDLTVRPTWDRPLIQRAA